MSQSSEQLGLVKNPWSLALLQADAIFDFSLSFHHD